MPCHLVQINIARLIAPIDDPKIAGFVAQLEPINSLADQAPGFLWRLQSESGNATDIAYKRRSLHPRQPIGLGVDGSAAQFCVQV